MPSPSADRPLLHHEEIESFTDEDVALVVETAGDYWTFPTPDALAWDILTALAAAGRLQPPNVENREEWTYTYRHSDGHVRHGEDGGEVYETREEVIRQFDDWANRYPHLPRRERLIVRREVSVGPWIDESRYV